MEEEEEEEEEVDDDDDLTGGHCDYSLPGAKEPSYANAPMNFPEQATY
jgi:hypothetical protein